MWPLCSQPTTANAVARTGAELQPVTQAGVVSIKILGTVNVYQEALVPDLVLPH